MESENEKLKEDQNQKESETRKVQNLGNEHGILNPRSHNVSPDSF